MPEAGLRVENLALSRGGRMVFSGIDLTLAPGEVLELRGVNGAGKSSLLLALAGLITPADGTIVWQGVLQDQEPRTLIHYLGHQTGVRPGLTLTENLAFWSALLDGETKAIAPALTAAGLGAIAGLDASVLSAGQQRRLGLARLLAIPRPVWLLDEPTSALDTAGAHWVGAMVGDHLMTGGIAIIATHLDIDYGPGRPPRRLDMRAMP